MKKLFFIWLMLELSFSQAMAQNNLPPAYEIQTDTAVSLRLDDAYWQMLEDPEGKWTIDEVNRPPIGDKFHANTTKVNGILGVDYSIHTFWLRYRLRNNMTDPARITLPKNVTYADLYTKASDGNWNHKMTGALLSWSKRSDLKGITTLIYIIQPGGELMVYERDSYNFLINQPDFLDIRFGFADNFIQDSNNNNNDSSILPSFIFGVFLLAALFNLYFFLIVRGRVYLYFSLTLFCYAISRFLESNDIFFREHPIERWYLFNGFGDFYFFFLVHFVRYFFETFRYFRRWDKYLIGLSIYFLLNSILINKDIFPIKYSDLTGPGIVVISILITFILFLRSHVRGVRLAILAVSPAFVIMAIPSLCVIFKLFNEHAGIPMPAFLKWIWVHNRFLVSEQISLLWMLIFFSWSLFQRYQQLQKTIAQEAIEKEIERGQFIAQRSELEMQALRAQMNPHFIFNSLNSINRFILQNNRLQASEYLTKFSKLVRMILQNSQASLISLESELESLELYLNLEAVRFDHHFEYKISVSKDLDKEVLKVPPLIIQPYVENAIWHGLMHKEEKGYLDIEVLQEDSVLYIKITDNGIGRKKAAELASKSATKHKSMGLRITAHRIAMMQQMNGDESPVQINDLVNPDGSAAGTEITIKMPILYD